MKWGEKRKSSRAAALEPPLQLSQALEVSPSCRKKQERTSVAESVLPVDVVLLLTVEDLLHHLCRVGLGAIDEPFICSSQ